MRVEGHIDTGRPADEIELLKGGPTWVPELPAKRTQGAPANPVAYPIADYPGTLSERHLAALETIRETATPVSRGWGVFVRLLPWLIPWLAICFGILYILDNPLWPLLIFAGLTAATVYGLNQQDYKHSAAGVEIHKADLAAGLKEKEIDNAHELRSKALDSYIKHLEKGQ